MKLFKSQSNNKISKLKNGEKKWYLEEHHMLVVGIQGQKKD